MTIEVMLEQSGVLTLLGMGVVFGFLIIMVIAITVAGKIIGKFVKEEGVKTTAAPTQKSGEVTAAIGAAINEYTKNQ